MPKVKLFHPPLYLSIFFFLLSFGGYIILNHHFARLWEKPDLQTYFIAAHDVLGGRNIYLSGHTYFNFLYTPFAALLFTPFTILPIEFFKWAMTISNIACLLLSTWLSLRFLGYQQKPQLFSTTLFLSTFLLWLEPVQQTLEYGQINLMMMAMVLVGFYLKDKPYWSGFLIGLAAAIKLTPAIFILYLFITKQTRPAIIAIMTIAITILIGYLIIPVSSHIYWSGLFLDTSRIGDPRLIGDQSLNAMLSRIFGMTQTTEFAWMVIAVAVGASGLLLATLVYATKNKLLDILIVAVTGLLISPFSWSHHWIWLAPLLIYFFHITYTKDYYYGWLGIITIYVLFGWLTPLIPNLSSMHHILNLNIPKLSIAPFLQENVYVLFGICFIGMAIISFSKNQPERHD